MHPHAEDDLPHERHGRTPGQPRTNARAAPGTRRHRRGRRRDRCPEVLQDTALGEEPSMEAPFRPQAACREPRRPRGPATTITVLDASRRGSPDRLVRVRGVKAVERPRSAVPPRPRAARPVHRRDRPRALRRRAGCHSRGPAQAPCLSSVPGHLARRSEDNPEGAAGSLVGFKFHAAAVGLGRPLHERQAQAGASHLAGPALVDAVEAVEDPQAVLSRDAWPLVDHGQEVPSSCRA